MADETSPRYEDAQEGYRQLLHAYGEALSSKDPMAAELFAQATAAWERLREFKGAEAELDSDMHLVAAFSFARQAGDALEAKRLYDAMSEKYRDTADGVETLKPGSMKIWLPR